MPCLRQVATAWGQGLWSYPSSFVMGMHGPVLLRSWLKRAPLLAAASRAPARVARASKTARPTHGATHALLGRLQARHHRGVVRAVRAWPQAPLTLESPLAVAALGQFGSEMAAGAVTPGLVRQVRGAQSPLLCSTMACVLGCKHFEAGLVRQVRVAHGSQHSTRHPRCRVSPATAATRHVRRR